MQNIVWKLLVYLKLFPPKLKTEVLQDVVIICSLSQHLLVEGCGSNESEELSKLIGISRFAGGHIYQVASYGLLNSVQRSKASGWFLSALLRLSGSCTTKPGVGLIICTNIYMSERKVLLITETKTRQMGQYILTQKAIEANERYHLPFNPWMNGMIFCGATVFKFKFLINFILKLENLGRSEQTVNVHW